MDQIRPEQAIHELTLVLMYLTRLNELGRKGLVPDQDIAWKGYDFEVINDLADDDLIWQGNRRAKYEY